MSQEDLYMTIYCGVLGTISWISALVYIEINKETADMFHDYEYGGILPILLHLMLLFASYFIVPFLWPFIAVILIVRWLVKYLAKFIKMTYINKGDK